MNEGRSGCGRRFTSRPLANCPRVVHWQAWSEEMERRAREVCMRHENLSMGDGPDFDSIERLGALINQ